MASGCLGIKIPNAGVAIESYQESVKKTHALKRKNVLAKKYIYLLASIRRENPCKD